jgi:hypothetical protein
MFGSLTANGYVGTLSFVLFFFFFLSFCVSTRLLQVGSVTPSHLFLLHMFIDTSLTFFSFYVPFPIVHCFLSMCLFINTGLSRTRFGAHHRVAEPCVQQQCPTETNHQKKKKKKKKKLYMPSHIKQHRLIPHNKKVLQCCDFLKQISYTLHLPILRVEQMALEECMDMGRSSNCTFHVQQRRP